MQPTGIRAKAGEKLIETLSQGKGWRESLSTGIVEQQRLKRQEHVADLLNKTARMESFGFEDLAAIVQGALDEMAEGMNTVMKARLFADKLQGGHQKDTLDMQKAEAERKLAIIAELTPHEKKWPKLLDRKARNAIAGKLEIEVEHVDELILEYQLQYAQWAFLRREFLRGRPVPQTSDDLESGIKCRPTREFVHVMKVIEKHKEKVLEKVAERNKDLRPKRNPSWGEKKLRFSRKGPVPDFVSEARNDAQLEAIKETRGGAAA